MTKSTNSPDLDLWKDQELFKKQHRLKLQFWEILSLIAEGISDQSLSEISKKHKSIKLSRGNDLLGMPYHVLDIIRDFDPVDGLNIRVLNWFGTGIYLFLIMGKKKYEVTSSFPLENNFFLSLTDSPWDYPGMILENQKTKTPKKEHLTKENHLVWFKEIPISGGKEEIIYTISEQISTCINELSTILRR
ncbi:hypothetical protein JYB64_14090 [Algoriphagus aestuarii]|nr:hypothetical protein [Algoriphagus aestuarii]